LFQKEQKSSTIEESIQSYRLAVDVYCDKLREAELASMHKDGTVREFRAARCITPSQVPFHMKAIYWTGLPSDKRYILAEICYNYAKVPNISYSF